ncbi:MAG: RidA family protein [Rhodobacteraceae bacterium]|nr:RidA family protein [Paracoccaceae bacterium]
MSRRLISTGSPFEQEIGYSRAVLQETPIGKFAWVAGTTGYDYTAMRMPDDPGEQARNALNTVKAALAEAEMHMRDVIRVRYYLTHKALVEEVIPILGDVFGDIRPAATMVIADLMKPEMLIEIEADAFKPIG